jgi:hypothetical protein
VLITKALFGLSANAVRASVIVASLSLPHQHVHQDGVRPVAVDPNFAHAHCGYALALQWDVWHYSTRSFLEVPGPAREEASIAVSLMRRTPARIRRNPFEAARVAHA